jgi:acetyl esterase/lipase
MRCLASLAALALLCLSAPVAAQVPTLSVKDVFALVREPPRTFEQIWEQRFEAAAKDARGEALEELRAARARGYIDFAYFHWRETGEAVAETWPSRRRAEAAIDVNDVKALERSEHRAFLDAWLRAEARARLASDAALRIGDNRWLRARFAVVEARVRERRVRRHLLHGALSSHIEDNGARGVSELIDRYVAVTGAAIADAAPLRTAVVETLAQSQGHRVETYKTVDGVALEAHVFAPAAAEGPRPALIWFHGGSWNGGSWAHCPTVCRVARERDYVVIQIEYRTEDRFASGPLAMIEDARDAVAWVRGHANELAVDRARVVIAGFSSGGSVAALLSTTSAPGDVRGAVLMAPCVAPLGDGWFRRMTAGRVSESEITPAANLGAADPAMFVVQGDADEMCPYSDTATFVKAAVRAGVEVEFLTLPGATHFFAFRSPDARARSAEGIARFLEHRR